MGRISLFAAALAVLPLVALPASSQPRPGAEQLPVKQVVLFSSGVGYFQRQGQVDGATRIDLQFHTSNINDLLKSLVLQDSQGGQVGTVAYDNRNPVEMTLKSFAIDLTANPTLADLLNQVRGEQVEVVTTADAKAATVGQSETVTGNIVGVERQRLPKEGAEVAQLNLLTKEGLRGVPLGQVQRVRFLKPALEAEFRKALEVLAAGHDKQKKTVSLHFTGSGKRRVRVGYVTESPVWKTSYRLSLDKDKLFLQGWAIVENTTDEDWNNVDLRLIAGRPVSFQMDLYQPLFVRRPVVEPELFSSLRPQLYGGNMAADQTKKPMPERRPAPKEEAAPPPPAAPVLGMPGTNRPVFTLDGRGLVRKEGEADKEGLKLNEGVASAAAATELGEYFQYLIAQPVSLPRQKSALIPILSEPVKGSEKVSIYNPAVHAKFPLLGLRFKNSTPLHLCQGPITVFEDGAYAGDAQIGNVQPGETRLLSYAIDLGTEVQSETRVQDELVKVTVVKGNIRSQLTRRESQTYTVKNRSAQPRQLLIEHPYRSDFKLVEPAKAAERSREFYRFTLKAEPDKPMTLKVVEDLPRVEQTELSNADDETVRVLLRGRAVSETVRQALQEALALREKVSELQQAVRKEEQALKVIEQDQARMRANMERVPQTSEAYKRYLKKFDDQETEIEQRRKRIAEAQQKADQQQQAYSRFLSNMTAE